MGGNGRRMRHRDWTIPLRVGGRYEAARARLDMGGHTSVQSLSPQLGAVRPWKSLYERPTVEKNIKYNPSSHEILQVKRNNIVRAEVAAVSKGGGQPQMYKCSASGLRPLAALGSTLKFDLHGPRTA
ncbi:hypothetical protein J6590_106317 [Homalodisca vitripennis]|nr:hypothetical protein J6590_106317 [Homalodisca vitripennis]